MFNLKVGLSVLAVVVALAGAAGAYAALQSSCCYPGAECCYPGSPCCGDCCAQGADCCPDGECCKAKEEVAADCCAANAECCPDGACCTSARAETSGKAKGGCCSK